MNYNKNNASQQELSSRTLKEKANDPVWLRRSSGDWLDCYVGGIRFDYPRIVYVACIKISSSFNYN